MYLPIYGWMNKQLNAWMHGQKNGWMHLCEHRWMSRPVFVKEKEPSQNYKFSIFGSFS